MAKRPTVLGIDKNPNNVVLLTRYLEDEGYDVVGANNYEELDKALDDKADYDLALVDITGFDQTIWERCRQLRDRGIPFFLISPRQSLALEQEGIVRGARGVLVKPLIVREMLALVRAMVEG